MYHTYIKERSVKSFQQPPLKTPINRTGKRWDLTRFSVGMISAFALVIVF